MSWIKRLLYTRKGRQSLMNWLGVFTVAGGIIVSAILIAAALENV